jgi:hypothetical protein
MVSPIIRIGSVTAQAGNSEKMPAAPTEPVQRPAASQPADSVHLSPAAMVRHLEAQGRTVQEIAAFMNVTPQVISSFLAGAQELAAVLKLEE